VSLSKNHSQAVRADYVMESCKDYIRQCSVEASLAGTFKCGNEPSGSIKCGVFLDSVRTGNRI